MRYLKIHIIAMVLGFIIVLISFLLSITYRPYIYQNHIYDFHIADTYSNWLAVPASTLFFWGYGKGKYKINKIILGSVIGFIIYEFILSGTLDILDIIATLLSGSIIFIIYKLYTKHKTRKTEQLNT